MNLSRIFIERPIMTTLVMAALVIFGLFGYVTLPLSDLPNVDFPTVSVSAQLPGADPVTMASGVAAVLENQGLRATSRGGHIAVREAVSAQLDPPLGGVLRPFDRLRRRRNQVEYPSSAAPTVSGEEIERDAPKVEQIVDVAAKVLDEMSPL